MTSDGSAMLQAALDKRSGLIDTAARAIVDPREPSSITHSIRDLFHQRVYGLVQGCRTPRHGGLSSSYDNERPL